MINNDVLSKFNLGFGRKDTLWLDYLETLGEAIKKEYSSIIKYKVYLIRNEDCALSFSVRRNNKWSDYQEFCAIEWSDDFGWRLNFEGAKSMYLLCRFDYVTFSSEEELQSIIISKIIMNPKLNNWIREIGK